MKKFRILFIIVFFLLFTGEATLFPAESNGKLKTITFFHANDIHGAIKNMGKVQSLVEREREENSNVFLVNAGDNFSGNPAVDQYIPKGEPILVLMNRLQFDVEELGNHDFDYGQKILKSFIFRAKFPVLCANVNVLPGNSFPRPYPYYLVKKKDGTEIVFLGVVQIEGDPGIPATLPERVKGLKFENGIEVVKRYIYLKRENNIFVVVSHLGIEDDIKLAEQVKGIDLIIGGHSHTVIDNPTEVNGALIVQAGSYLKYLGRVDITTRDGKIISKKGRLINLSKVHSSNHETDLLVKKFNDNPELKKVLTNLKYPVTGRRKLGLMVADALRNRLKLDIVFYNQGGIRINRLYKDVTIKDVYSMHPFGNYIVKVVMDTSEIKDLIRNDFKSHNRIDIISSGISYRVVKDLDDNILAVELFDPQGKEIRDGREFTVGLNNYIVSSYKFRHKDPGVSTNIKTVDIMLDYFKNLKKSPDYSRIVRARELTLFRGRLEKIGKTEVDLHTQENKYMKNSSTGNLIADAIRDYSKSDIAVFPTRLLKKGVRVEAGKSIFGKILPAMFDHIKDNNVVTVKMTGKSLYDFLLKRFTFRNNIDVHLSGLNCNIIRDGDNRVKKLELSLPKGNKFSFSGYYKVAFTEFDFNKFYKLRGEISEKTVLPDSTFTILKNYIKKIGTLGKETGEKRIIFKN